LRRLTTDDLVQLAAATGLRLEFEAYANQYYGAIRWITEDPRNALRLTNTKGIRDKAQTRRLTRLRLGLFSVSAARFAASGLEVICSLRFGNRLNLAKAAVATLLGPLLPLCCLVDSRVRARAEAEWKQRAGDRAGSEMYLAFGPAQ
jgi:hypothetical protein